MRLPWINRQQFAEGTCTLQQPKLLILNLHCTTEVPARLLYLDLSQAFERPVRDGARDHSINRTTNARSKRPGPEKIAVNRSQQFRGGLSYIARFKIRVIQAP